MAPAAAAEAIARGLLMRAKVEHPATKTIAVKVPRETARKLLIEANKNCRTRSGEARHLVERALNQDGGNDHARA